MDFGREKTEHANAPNIRQGRPSGLPLLFLCAVGMIAMGSRIWEPDSTELFIGDMLTLTEWLHFCTL